MDADHIYMTTSTGGNYVTYTTNLGEPAYRREWSGWKAGLRGLEPPDPESVGPREPRRPAPSSNSGGTALSVPTADDGPPGNTTHVVTPRPTST